MEVFSLAACNQCFNLVTQLLEIDYSTISPGIWNFVWCYAPKTAIRAIQYHFIAMLHKRGD
jgi:hypothetical protein